MIKLLRGPIDKKKTYLEIDEEILSDISGIEVQAGGSSYIIRFARPTKDEPGIIEVAPTRSKGETTHKIAMKTFHSLLRRTRLAAGLTHVELCEKSGLAKSTISRFETGRGLPNPTSLAALNAALNTNWEM